jgi:DNA-directed RNA polymerase specialized sigma subunit
MRYPANGVVAVVKKVNIEVRAEREGRLWVLHLSDGGVTQARSLGEIEAMVIDYASVTLQAEAAAVHVTVTNIDPGNGLKEEIAAARKAQAEAARAQESAANRVRSIARALKNDGLSGMEIATVLGVSKQRVSQLIAEPKLPAKVKAKT